MRINCRIIKNIKNNRKHPRDTLKFSRGYTTFLRESLIIYRLTRVDVRTTVRAFIEFKKACSAADCVTAWFENAVNFFHVTNFTNKKFFIVISIVIRRYVIYSQVACFTAHKHAIRRAFCVKNVWISVVQKIIIAGVAKMSFCAVFGCVISES